MMRDEMAADDRARQGKKKAAYAHHGGRFIEP
jgi:hypothetical protein